MSFPDLCVVDTNVPKIANLATRPDSAISLECILNCVEAIQHVTSTRALVLDDGDEIFDEYRQQLSLKGQPGIGDYFMKWVHDNRWNLAESQRVSIERNGDTYKEFPHADGLEDFDPSDRKFVAVANAHPDKPAILQATDSKWWGWKEALLTLGIKVNFLCEKYVLKKFREKMT